MVVMIDNSLGRYVFQFLLVFFPKVADQVLTEQVSLGFKMMEVVRMVILDERILSAQYCGIIRTMRVIKITMMIKSYW